MLADVRTHQQHSIETANDSVNDNTQEPRQSITEHNSSKEDEDKKSGPMIYKNEIIISNSVACGRISGEAPAQEPVEPQIQAAADTVNTSVSTAKKIKDAVNDNSADQQDRLDNEFLQ